MVVSVLSYKKTNNYKFFKDLLSVKKSEMPCLRYIVSDGFYTKKFKFTGKVTTKRIKKFLNAILKGKKAPYFKSMKKIKIKKRNKFIRVILFKNFGNLYYLENCRK